VRAARLSYTGELGWELYVPTEFAASVYKTVVTAGTDLNLRGLGTLALNSLRAERGFRAWGHELDADTTPLEAGIGFVARTDKPSDFIGRGAILRQREEGMKRRLVFATLEDPAGYPIGSEPILHDGEVVGQVTSAVFGHTVGRAVVMGYVSGTREEIARRIASGGFGVEIAGRQFAANASLDAPLAARTST
jgi:4-methylaminobutanoate oxidase (formaldehyde-forming)